MRRAALLAVLIVLGLSAGGPVAAEAAKAASAYPDSDGRTDKGTEPTATPLR